eukprot:TRINITY_DN1234_c0_g1_i1.p1 TRINITY_DN1234_c0_g1~~TRINITY_DN1234_c0_g1_i1.p1  ORF type:complete len:940 (-),score=174.86 TRINITY_DN1234_c0_g1_i1:63-2834(-)
MALAAESACTEALHCVASLVQGGDLDEAADVLRNECGQASAAALADARHSVLTAFVQQDKVDSAVAFALECLRAPGERQELQQQSQDLLLRALLQAQQHSRAVELLRAICQCGSAVPGDQVFNGLLDAAVRARSYGDAWDVLELLLTCGRKADKYFVSILTKSLESAGDKRVVRRGIALVDRFIDQQKDDVDEIVFNSLLNVLGGVLGDMPKLQSTLDKMTEYGVSPSAVTFGTVVKAYGRAGDIDAVLRVWQQMRSRCLGVNPVTCGCVLDACVKCGSLDKALAIFQEMRSQGMHKNTVLYATLIKGLAKVRDLQSALNFYQDMRMEGVPCNLVTFNSLMDVCVRCSDLQAAAYFLQDMMAMGIQPDLITFSTLIKGYSQIGEVHKALALSKELKSRGLKCDEIMYNSLIDGCAKAHKLHEGLVVFSEMLQSRVQPSNITFSILVKLHFQAGQMVEAFKMVDDMYPRYQCTPNRVVYSVLLRCCTQHGGAALARGAQLLVDLASKRNSKLPDQVMVSSLLSACVQHSDYDTAAQVVRDFTAFGGTRRSSVTVGFDSLKILFEALGAEQEQLGLELLEHLRCKSMPPMQISALEAALADGKQRGAGWAASRAAETVAAAGDNSPGADSYAGIEEAHRTPLYVPSLPEMHAGVSSVTHGSAPSTKSFPMHPYAHMHDPILFASGFAHLPPYAPSPYYGHYDPAVAAAAASAAAVAVYNQHMASYAAAVASASVPMAPPASPHALFPATSPECSPAAFVQSAMPGFASPLSPPVPSASTPLSYKGTPSPTSAALSVPPVPASFLGPSSGSFLPAPKGQAQAPSPAQKPQAAAAVLALTPLPAGPLSPSASVAVTPPPAAQRPVGTAEKPSAGKENSSARRNKDSDTSTGKKGGKGSHQSRESQQTKQLREKAAALQAMPAGQIGI